MVELTPGARVTGDQRTRLRAALVKKYTKGASIRALAEETGRSYGFIHTVLTEAGVTLRARGGHRSHKPRKTTKHKT
jgi:transposase